MKKKRVFQRVIDIHTVWLHTFFSAMRSLSAVIVSVRKSE